jgi:phosphoglycolate phosphatase
MPIRGVIFDLDGTLVDTLGDIADSVNHVLESLALPSHPIEAYRFMVGNGSRMLITRALGPERQHLFETVLKQQQDYYPRHMCDHSVPYRGIVEMLGELQARSIKRAVLSNKPHEHTRQMVEKLFGMGLFDAVIGQRSEIPLKPDPASALEIAKMLGLEPSQLAMVGDTAMDMQTGRRAGMTAVGVTWGFRERGELIDNGGEHIIDEPRQLIELL